MAHHGAPWRTSHGAARGPRSGPSLGHMMRHEVKPSVARHPWRTIMALRHATPSMAHHGARHDAPAHITTLTKVIWNN